MELHIFRGKRKKTLFFKGEIVEPITIIVAKGKTRIVGIAEVGDKTYTIERSALFTTVDRVFQDLLTEAGVPASAVKEERREEF